MAREGPPGGGRMDAGVRSSGIGEQRAGWSTEGVRNNKPECK